MMQRITGPVEGGRRVDLLKTKEQWYGVSPEGVVGC